VPFSDVPATIHHEHLPTLRGVAAALKAAVGNDRRRLQALGLNIARPNELAIGQTTMDLRAQAIVDYNAVSGLAPDIKLPGVQPGRGAACLAAVRVLGGRVHLQPLLTTAQGLTKLIDVHALGPAHLGTIATLMEYGANVTAIHGFGATLQSMNRLTAVLTRLPPMTANAALAWGRGAESDVATNQTVHFEKHVLKLHGNDDADEPWKWKQILGLNISGEDFKAWSGGRSWSNERPDLFPHPSTASITTESQYKYFIEDFLPTSPLSQDGLKSREQNAYTAAVAANSTALAIVISDGGDVFKVMGNKTISGQTVFIVAKLEDDLSAFTISSAYAPKNDKVAANQVRRLYRLA
jgi:hypothetical protein